MTYRYSSNLKAFRESELDYLKRELKLADKRVDVLEESLSSARIAVLELEAAVEVKMESDSNWIAQQENTHMPHILAKPWRNYEEFNAGYNALRSKRTEFMDTAKELIKEHAPTYNALKDNKDD